MTTQLILAAPQTPIIFGPAGIGDVLWTPQNTALGNGRIGNVWDRGAGHVPVLYRWLATARWVATPLANDRWSLWLVTADDDNTPGLTDGTFTYGDAALTSEAELVANCRPLGTVLATATDKLFVSSGEVAIYSRWVTLAGWNGSATKALTNTAADTIVRFTPVPLALQAPA